MIYPSELKIWFLTASASRQILNSLGYTSKIEELLREWRSFSAPVLDGKELATNHLIAQAISALKGRDCLSCRSMGKARKIPLLFDN